jgi:DNA polymerase alpha subunit A
VTLLIRECLKKYYDSWLICDDHSCGRRTMQQSVREVACTSGECHGRMIQEYDAIRLYTQLKYLESMFDVTRMKNKMEMKPDE